MRATLMWTISDFPTYGMLSGWSTKGYMACPNCHVEHGSCYLTHSRKCVYLRHRRFLSPHHRWREDTNHFDGKEEYYVALCPLSREDILGQWDGCANVCFGKKSKGASGSIQEHGKPLPNGWKKLSIFFGLPYWKTALVRHNLDVMHIEKNVCDNILNTLLEKDGKCKDNLNARKDLLDMGIRHPLHPQTIGTSGKYLLPHACYHMTNQEKEGFLTDLKNLKLPYRFSSNFSQRVQVKEWKCF